MYVCMYVYVCMYECMNVCMYACMYVCMYVCMYGTPGLQSEEVTFLRPCVTNIHRHTVWNTGRLGMQGSLPAAVLVMYIVSHDLMSSPQGNLTPVKTM